MAGFAAATYLRGVPWVAVPTTLVGQVDAAIGGKTAVNLPEGKNLVGAFHWPERTAIDPVLLETLPPEERRAGMAEVVKTGLLAGEPLWELPTDELVRRCAAYKAAICLRDPYERGERAVLNLGHTFAHALEAAGDYHGPSHGEAVALGLLAALRLTGQDTSAVEDVLRPQPVRVNRDAAWAALARDKKSINGSPRLVLLEAPGKPVTGVELPEQQVREALDALIAE
jgi:shikimate kinase / 3-dehydroquinate synthase